MEKSFWYTHTQSFLKGNCFKIGNYQCKLRKTKNQRLPVSLHLFSTKESSQHRLWYVLIFFFFFFHNSFSTAQEKKSDAGKPSVWKTQKKSNFLEIFFSYEYDNDPYSKEKRKNKGKFPIKNISKSFFSMAFLETF